MTNAPSLFHCRPVCCLLFFVTLCRTASGEVEPPECCESPFELYASYESSLMLYGAFFGAELDSSHVCLRWIDNANGYFEHTVHETNAADGDVCGNEESFENADWQLLLGNLEWTWSGAPGVPVPDIHGNDKSFRVRVPIAETQSYDLEVEVLDIGGDSPQSIPRLTTANRRPA